jgi:uncharacterized protein (TIGR02271 family)
MATTRKIKHDNTVSKAVGTGVGIAGGAAAGAGIGSVVPGVGTAIGAGVGAVVGAVAGGVTGNLVAEAIDPSEEEVYWKEEYKNRPYYEEGTSFKEYSPAYRFGVEAANKYRAPYTEVEKRLNRNWPKSRGESSLTWSKARDAVADAYERTLRLHEERLKVQKESVKAGEVAVRTEVVTEHQRVDVPVEREEVVIKRRPVNGPARPGGLRATEREAEIRIPVKEQRVKVTKETVPVEEVSIGRRKVQGTEKVNETVKKERLATNESGSPRVRRN